MRAVQDFDDLLALMGGNEVVDHLVDVSGLCGRPDDDFVVVQHVLEEVLEAGAWREAAGTVLWVSCQQQSSILRYQVPCPYLADQERAIEIKDHQERSFEEDRAGRELGHLHVERVWPRVRQQVQPRRISYFH